MTGCPNDLYGSEILAKSDFSGSMKDAGNCLGREGHEKKTEGFCLGYEKRPEGFFWVY